MPARHPTRHTVLILCDGLGAGFLGTYGNGWLSTPAFDRLATRSLVVEYPWIDSTSPVHVVRSILQGDHACSRQPQGTSLSAIAESIGTHSLLISDCSESVTWPCVAGFQECELFPVSAATSCAEHLESTELFSFFSAVSESIDALADPSFVMIYVSGLSHCWDAPWQLRAALSDESDPAPGHAAQPSRFELQDDDDPDQQLLALQSYAAQVAVLDACLGSTIALIDEVFDPQETLVILTGTRGYPLGQHRIVGYRTDLLHAEQLHVPLLCRSPATLHSGARCNRIVQPSGIYPVLASWLRHGDPFAPLHGPTVGGFAPLQRAMVSGGNSEALRVPGWYFVDRSPPHDSSPELFVKPDDRWEINNIASLCPEIVDAMRREMAASRQAAEGGQWAQQPELPAELLRPCW